MGDLLQSVMQGSAEALEPVTKTVELARCPDLERDATGEDGAPGSVQAIPPIVIGQDMAETLGAKVGDGVLVIESAGGVDAAGNGAAVSEVSGGGDLQVGVLSVRLELCVSFGWRMRRGCSVSRI